MRFNSRRSGGLNLKGAGMKKIIPPIPSDVTVTLSPVRPRQMKLRPLVDSIGHENLQ